MTLQEDIAFATYYGKINVYVNFYFTVIFGSIGLILNTLGIVVYKRKAFADMSMSFYNIVIACVNNICILSYLWQAIPLYFNVNIKLNSQAECMLVTYLQMVAGRLSAWIETLITVDRMVCIIFSNKFLFMKNRKVLSVVIAALLAVSLAISSQYFQFELVRTPSNTTISPNVTVATITATCSVDKAIILSINVLAIVTRVAVPFVIMIVSNIFLIYHLKRVRRERWMKKEEAFARSVVALSVFFLLTNLPLAVIAVYQIVLAYDGSSPLSRSSVLVNLVYTLSMLLSSYNYVFPTLVNLMFNKIFRQEFLIMFGFKNKINSTRLSSETNPTR